MSMFTLRGAGTVAAAVLFATATWAAEPIRPASKSRGGSSSQRGATAGRAVLPDPALLDGSSFPAEKRPEFGMVGEFELPGDQNVRSDQVGGGGGQNPNQQQQGAQAGSGGLPGLPQAGGGGQEKQDQPPAIPPAGEGGPQNADAAGEQVAGAGDPNAQAQGAQVAELQGQGGTGEQGAISEKPPEVSIGDSAMQIQTVANAPTVVGGEQPAGKTQQHEKTTGTGGKTAVGNNANKGVERGRTMPAGL